VKAAPVGGGAVVAVLATAVCVWAHAFEPAILDVRERDAGVYDVVWKSPAARAGTDPAVGGPLAPRFPSTCRAEAQGGSVEGTGVAMLRVDCRPGDLHGQPITIDGLNRTRLDAIIRIAWRTGAPVTGIARASDDTFVVPGVASGVPTGEIVRRYAALGIEHILTGYDHLLFVLAMLLLVERIGAVVRTLTAFTLAHSVTLACAVLGIVRVAPAPVEAAIALSIVLLATELARPPDALPTLTRRYPWMVAFGFGLLHGLGFAGALSAVGLPADQVPLALAAFNVGVEVGQLLFVAVAAAPVALWRRTDHRLWRLVPAYAIGTVAMVWTIERVALMAG
jgi:hydrogenase/urease accessory protein HupE